MNKEKLNMFRLYNSELVIAKSKIDAWKVLEEHEGERLEEDIPNIDCELILNSTMINIGNEETNQDINKTVGNWVKSEGRGWLASSEW